MSFPAGSIVATIQLDGMNQFQRDLSQAKSLMGLVGDAGRKAGDLLNSGFRVAVGTLGIATTAAAGYLTTVLATGAAYNTLQQTSRAALRTLLGGAEAANDQMAKLDDFARQSPFSKAVFIQAQQQLLGFGVEAQRVIPILGAVQDAVAATGGSSDAIAQITDVLAKVQSQGKITGEELMQFGARGINAAGMIGDAMGLSVEETRKAISESKVDAETAINALVDGMTKKYGGAAAEVKKTWSGAVDRIKAANREIGAALAEPFISQQGGGLAITWGNQVADVMRAALTHVKPLTEIMTTRLTPAFGTFTQGLDTLKVIVKSWDSAQFESFLTSLEDYGPALGLAAGGFLAINSQLLQSVPILGSLLPAINPVVGAFVGLALASPELRDALGGLIGAFDPLKTVIMNLATAFADSLNRVLPIVADLIEGVADVVAPLIQAFAEIPTPLLLGAAAGLAFTRAFGPLKTVLTTLIATVVGAGKAFVTLKRDIALQTAVSGMTGTMGALAGTMSVAATGAKALGGALKAAFLNNPLGIVLTGVSIAVGILTANLADQADKAQKTKDRIQEYSGTLVDSTGAVTAATRELVAQRAVDDGYADKLKEVGVSMLHYTGAIFSGTAAEKEFQDALNKSRLAAVDATADKGKLQYVADELGLTTQTVSRALAGEAEAMELVNKLIVNGGNVRRGAEADYRDLTVVADKSTESHRALEAQMKAEQDAILQASQLKRLETAARRDALAAMSEEERRSQRMTAALEIAADETQTVTTRLQALKQALDDLGGKKDRSEADRLQALNDETRKLADAFNILDEAGANVSDSLVLATGEIDTSTAAGSNLRTAVQGLNDEMLTTILELDEVAKKNGENGISADAAREAYKQYETKLREVAAAAGVSADKVDALVAAMLDTPEVISFAITDSGTTDARRLEAIQLAMQIRDTPNGQFDVESEDIPLLREALRYLGVDITSLPAGTVRVQKDDGSFQAVDLALDHIARGRSSRVYVSYVYDGTQGGLATPRGGSAVGANGMMFDKGQMLAFANGGIKQGFPTGIYSGRVGAIHKFAEPETIWEAYVSGKPSQKERNQKILQEAARRLGGAAMFADGGITSSFKAFANGGITSAGGPPTAAELAKAYKEAAAERERQRRAEEARAKQYTEEMRVRDVAEYERRLKADARISKIKDESERIRAKVAEEDRRSRFEAETAALRDAQRARENAARAADNALEKQKQTMERAYADEKAAREKAAEDAKRAREEEVAARRKKIEDEQKAAAAEATRLRDWLANSLGDWETSLRRGGPQSSNGLQLVDKLQAIADQLGGKAKDRLTAQARESEKAFLALQGRLAETSQAVADSASWLDKLRSSASNMYTSVKNAVAGLFNLGQLGKTTTERVAVTKQIGEGRDAYWETTEEDRVTKPTAGSIASGMAAPAGRIKAFAEKLKKLAGKVPASLLAEIAGLGVEAGEPIVDALLSATAAELQSIADSYGAIDEWAGVAGSTVRDQNFKELLTQAEKELASAEKNAADLQAKLEKETNRIIDAITKALNTKITIPVVTGTDGSKPGTTLPPAKAPVKGREYGLEPVTPMLMGGIRPPMIAAGGSNILWAEGKVGEAYIPFDPTYREQALDVWTKAGRAIGAHMPAADARQYDQSINVKYIAGPTTEPISDQKQLENTVRRARRLTGR